MTSANNQRIAVALVVMIALSAAYTLSLGPAWVLANHGVLSGPAFETIYAPFVWLEASSATGEHVVQCYLKLWADWLPQQQDAPCST